MLLWLSHFLSHYVHAFRVFQYITFRTITAALTSLLVALIFSPFCIKRLRMHQIGQAVRDDGPQSHLKKTGTPTMGGVIILFSILLSMLLWGDLRNVYLWVALATMLMFGVVGFWDDYKKELESDVADIKNLGGAEAGHITAGKFLEYFVDYPWIHLDIAGSAFLKQDYLYNKKGGTGVGVRLLTRWLENNRLIY